MNHRRINPIVAASVALCLVAPITVAAVRGASATRGLPNPGDYNVVLILLDDLGTDKLKMYRESAECAPTPVLDNLWSHGIQFTRANVNPVCSPTRAAILSGRQGFRTGIGTHISEGDNPPYKLQDEEVFLGELLRDATAGTYMSGAFGKWHLTTYTGDDCHPGVNGFDRYHITIGNNSNYYRWRKISNDANDPTQCEGSTIPAVGETDPYSTKTWQASVARADAVHWIKDEIGTGQPFFAYVTFNPPHAPQQVPPRELLSRQTRLLLEDLNYVPGDYPERRHARVIHDTMIEAVDTDIGLLLDPTVGIPQATLDKTVVIVLGDNGTERTMISPPHDPTHSKRSLYQGGVRVPMIVAGPLVPAGAEGAICTALVNAVDVWRTVANIAGLTDAEIDDYMDTQFTPGSHPVDAQSFFAQIEDPTAAGVRETVYSEFFPNGPPPPNSGLGRTVRDGVYRYIRKATAPAEELYDETTDPAETDNILLHASLTTDEADALCRLRDAMRDLSGGYGCRGPRTMTTNRTRR